ncbi:MAG: RNA-directed DNA polymerase domain-containing protein [Limisphaerales bacterium]|nr:MAG: RNA-directed DNA polymerase domain-containing protein [Limisphaerales bacterium]TXT47516.1 MAG: RNA-directed DNA polymerase domain-containing protein [Limisphaerales bacterium]
MGLLDFIRSLFGPPKRDISRLSGETVAGEDEVDERVDVSGGLLKEHHRRRALRDPRLLPKRKSVGRQLGLAKRKRVLSAAEAERLFSGTMRTRNRRLRDLLVDPEQLKRLGLPLWKTEEEVAAALGISLRELWFFAIHRERETQPHYVTFAIPKRSGGKRTIMAPKRRLKAIQRKLLGLLVEKLPVSEHAHAFRRGHSVRTGAEPHVGKRMVLKLDLKDFFPSVTMARVRGLLIACGYSYPVATTLAVLMTEAERQLVSVEAEVFHVPVGPRHCVQGAPTSPGLCNALVLRLDRRLAGLARKRGLAYTRYADDLTFSGEFDRAAAQQFRQVASRIISEEGFTVNTAKTRLMGRGARQSVTGVVVNSVLGLSRQRRRQLRAMAHRLKLAQRAGTAEGTELARFAGHMAYLAMLNPRQAARIPVVD